VEGFFGRLIAGALWGAGASLVVAVTREGRDGLRPFAKNVVKTCLSAADRFVEMTQEARESLNDVCAEVRAERDSAETGP
jgi:hypothetical protein